MWLDNLKELKKKTGMSCKQIADMTNLPERTVVRIMSGDTDAPRVDTLRRIVAVLGGSLDDIFAESGSVVANTDLTALREEVEKLTDEATIMKAEIAMLKDKNARLEADNGRLHLTLAHKEEIISLHNYYNKLKSNE